MDYHSTGVYFTKSGNLANLILGKILTKTSILKQNFIEDGKIKRNWQYV